MYTPFFSHTRDMALRTQSNDSRCSRSSLPRRVEASFGSAGYGGESRSFSTASSEMSSNGLNVPNVPSGWYQIMKSLERRKSGAHQNESL